MEFKSKPLELIDKFILAVDQTLTTGAIPAHLPDQLSDRYNVQELLQRLSQIYQFIFELSKGNLEPELKMKGKVAGVLKSLQSNLRHLTWQTQRIASGDLSHRVEFMGEFSQAFNLMVENIRSNREQLERHAQELGEQREAALSMMLAAQAAQREVERINQQLQAQLEEIQQLQTQLHEQAIRDPLTGIYNRLHMIESLQRELARSQRENYPISLIILDVDHFKILNDTFGHHIGDLILQNLGKLLLTNVRLGDIPCRYGGDEFVIIFPNVSPNIAIRRAEALRRSFSSQRFSIGEKAVKATFSAGLAACPLHTSDLKEILIAADVALYQAKLLGRNQVRMFDPSKKSI